MINKLWGYGTSTPTQRIGVIILFIGIFSLISWMIKEDLSLDNLADPYYLPRSRDSLFFHLFPYLIPIGLLMSWGYRLLLVIRQWILVGETNNQKPQTKTEKPKYNTSAKNLHFKNNQAAFQFASKSHIANMSVDNMDFGIVQDVIKLHDNSFQFLIQLANNGRTTLVSGFNDKYANKISKGNLVYWGFVEPVDSKENLGIEAIGHVLAVLAPEFDSNIGGWVVKQDLTK